MELRRKRCNFLAQIFLTETSPQSANNHFCPRGWRNVKSEWTNRGVVSLRGRAEVDVRRHQRKSNFPHDVTLRRGSKRKFSGFKVAVRLIFRLSGEAKGKRDVSSNTRFGQVRAAAGYICKSSHGDRSAPRFFKLREHCRVGLLFETLIARRNSRRALFGLICPKWERILVATNVEWVLGFLKLPRSAGHFLIVTDINSQSGKLGGRFIYLRRLKNITIKLYYMTINFN